MSKKIQPTNRNQRLQAEIVQRQQAEEERARLLAVIDSSADFIGMADPDGRLLYLNRAARRMISLAEDADLSGLTISDMHPPGAFALITTEGFPALHKDGSWSSENALLHRDGTEIPVSQVLVLHRDANGQPAFVSTIMRDITEAKRAEAELRESERHLRLVINTAPIALWEVDRHGTVLLSEGKSLTQLGLKSGELVGRSSLQYDEHDPEALAHILRGLAGEEFHADVHVRGSYWSNDYIPIRDEHGDVSRLVGISVDVSQLKQAEQAAVSVREQLAAVMNSAPDSIAAIDADFRYTLLNDAYAQVGERLFGVTFQIGASVRDLLAPWPEDLALALEYWGRALGGETFVVSQQFGDNGRQRQWFELHFAPVRNADGAVVGAVNVTRDVTERRRTEDLIASSEAKYRALFENLREHISVYDVVRDASGHAVDWVLRECNAVGRAWFGGRYGDVVGRPMIELFGETMRPHIERTDAFVRGERTLREVFFSPTDEYFLASTFALNADTIVSATLDVTERKRLEQAMTTSRERMESVLEGSRDLIWMLDMSLRVVIFNRAFQVEFSRIFGRRIEIGVSMKDTLALEPGVLKVATEHAQRALDGADFTASIPLGDPLAPAWYELRYTPARNTLGAIVGVVVIARDVTERKQIEEERLRSARREQRLKRAESLNRVAGATAHLFNNGIQAIMGNLDLCLSEMHDGAGGSIEFLQQAVSASSRAAEVGRLMLTYVGQSSRNHVRLDLGAQCRVGASRSVTAGAPRVKIILEIPDAGPSVMGHSGRIQELLGNLIDNARESYGASPGQVRVSMTTVPVSQIPVRRWFPVDWEPDAPHYACVEVADQGCGIADADIEFIFDPFFSRKFTGRGMGLAVVLGILRSHDGGISVQTAVGAGSVFSAYLPVVDGPVDR